jgi:Flp pilus assembly protein TadD
MSVPGAPLVSGRTVARALIVIGALLCPGLAAAQVEPPAPGAAVSIRVTSLEGEHPLERVRVKLLRFPEEQMQEGFTDANGHLEFQGLQTPAAYILRAEKDGFQTTDVRFDLRRGQLLHEVHIQMPAIKETSAARPAGVSSTRMLAIPPPASKEFQKGLELLNQKKNLRLGVEHFQKAIAIYPGYFEAYFLMGMTYLQLNSPGEAQEALRQAIKLNPRFLEPYYPLAVLLQSQKRHEEAERLLLDAMTLDKQDWRWPFEVARSRGNRGQWDKALEYAKLAQSCPKAPPKVHLLLADIYSNTGNTRLAIAELEQFSKLDPQSPFMPKVRATLQELREKK